MVVDIKYSLAPSMLNPIAIVSQFGHVRYFMLTLFTTALVTLIFSKEKTSEIIHQESLDCKSPLESGRLPFVFDFIAIPGDINFS